MNRLEETSLLRNRLIFSCIFKRLQNEDNIQQQKICPGKKDVLKRQAKRHDDQHDDHDLGC